MSREGKIDSLVEWSAILNDLGVVLHQAKDRSLRLRARSDDPRMVSSQLFLRLAGHSSSFAVLFNHDLILDAEIICRSAIEVAICLANLNLRGAAFVADLRSDAAHTLVGQLPVWFGEEGPPKEEYSAELEEMFGATRADGTKHTRLAWRALADGAAIPDLYRWYRHLSATAAHVTGISILQSTVPADSSGGEEQSVAWRRVRKRTAMGFMCGAKHFGCRAHAETLGYEDILTALDPIMERIVDVSSHEKDAEAEMVLRS